MPGDAGLGDGGSSALCAPQPRYKRQKGPQKTKDRKPARHAPAGKEGIIEMANILVDMEKGIEIGAKDALRWLIGANNAVQAAPEVIAALATLIGALEKPLQDISGAAQNPLNIALDIQTVRDLKAAWPAVKQFLGPFGVKF